MTKSVRASSAVSSRYAGALLDLAHEKGAVEAVIRDMQALREIIAQSPEFGAFIASPAFSPKKQTAVLDSLSAKADLSPLTRNFLGVLIANRRLNALPPILEAFAAEKDRRSGIVTAHVTAAQDLSAAEIDSLQKALSKGMGQTVQVKASVEKDILGGLIVTVGSTMVDDSVRRKLERLRLAMSGNANQNTEIKKQA